MWSSQYCINLCGLFSFFCQWEELKYAVNAAKMSSVRSVYLALGKAASVSSTQVLYDLTLKERLQRLQTAVWDMSLCFLFCTGTPLTKFTFVDSARQYLKVGHTREQRLAVMLLQEGLWSPWLLWHKESKALLNTGFMLKQLQKHRVTEVGKDL